MTRISMLGSVSLPVLAATGAVIGQSSTETYTYDTLGRLVEARTAGGQYDDQAHEICYDASGNRVRYRATDDGTSITCPTAPAPSPSPSPSPTPTPTPTGGGNLPPDTAADHANGTCLTSAPVNLTVNDTDPENNVPLVLQSIVRTSGASTATIVSVSSVQVNFGPNYDLSAFTYTVADSLGATSTGQLTTYATCGGELDP